MKPQILFKYRADGEFSEKIISDRQVWLSVAKDLNDPFECQTGLIPLDWKLEVIRKKEDAQLMGAIFGPGFRPVETLLSLDRRRTKRWLKRLAKSTHREKVAQMRKLYREHNVILSDPARTFDDLERQLSSVGILSLSAVDDDQLMWAHYGASHAGLAFGFGVEEGVPLASPANLLEVSYADEKPAFAGGYIQELRMSANVGGGLRSESRFSFEDPIFRASISTKPTAWAYEREWRYVHEQSGAHELPAELRTVTFGLRMPEHRKMHYARLLREHGHRAELFGVQTNEPGKLCIVPFDPAF